MRFFKPCIAFIALALAAGAFRCAAAPAAETGTVREVVARLIVHAEPFPDLLKSRLADSVQAAGDKALLNKPLAEAGSMKGWLEENLSKIYGDFGFDATSAIVEIGAVSYIRIEIEPRGPRVGSVTSHIIAPGLHKSWFDEFTRRAMDLEAIFNRYLAGTPIEAQTWAGEVISEAISALPELKEIFPGFDVIPQIYFGVEGEVALRLRAAGPTVRTVSVKMRSRTVPSLALDRFKFLVTSRSEFLVGMPIAFLETNEERLEPLAAELIGSSGAIRSLKLDYRLRFLIGRSAIIFVDVNSRLFSGFLRANINLGREENNPDLEGHFGVILKDFLELFGESNFQPGPIRYQASVGAGAHLTPNLFFGAGREFREGFDRLWIDYYPAPDLKLSWEEGNEDDRREGSVTFQAHEFFSVQGVSDFQNDVWVRFVVNL